MRLNIIISLFCSLCCVVFSAQAQVFSFRLTDASAQPVEGAVVHLLSARDSSLFKTEISDARGAVEGTLPPETTRFLMVVNALGFAEWRGSSDALLPDNTLQLTPVSADLKEVTITARKPMFEVKSDKLVFNVQNSTLATGNTALELLRKSPGVIVDQNDNIALRGKNGVRIYIDGKPSPLGNADLAAQLQAMQASDIEAIEIIANPSARYDAAGNAGIINIRLKKNKNYGVNGTISTGLTQGRYLRNNNNVSLNYRNRQINLFGTYGNNFGKSWNFFDFYRRQNGLIFDQKTESTWAGNNHNYKAGVDWFLAKNHTLGVVVNGFANQTVATANTTAPVYLENAPNVPIELLLSGSSRRGNRDNLNTNLNYQWAANERSLNVDADYGTYDLWANETVPNRYVAVNNPNEIIREVDFYSETPTDIDLYSVKMDWEQAFGKKITWSAGAKTARVRTDNTFTFLENNVPDPTRSNQFVYDEAIHALYTQTRFSAGKWEGQLGLRAENTRSEGNLRTANDIADKNVRRNYLDLFPSASAAYSAGENHRWGISYSRRIDRPVYADLNPFEYRLNELTYFKGNPFLLPQYTHTAEVSHTWKWTLNTSLSYSYVNNYFANLSDTIEERRSFLRKENFDDQRVWNLTSSYPFQINARWSGFATATASYTAYRANFAPGKTIDIQNYAVSTYAQTSYRLGRGFSVELSGSYNTPSVWGGTYRNRVFWFMDAGAQYKNDRFSVRMVLGDVFQSMRWRGVAEFGGLYAVASGGWDSRQLRLNATYNFGKTTVKDARQRKSATEDLKNRVE